MTPEQLTTLGNHIRANQDQVIVDALANGNLGDIRDWYNAESASYVWRTSVSVDEANEVIDWPEFCEVPEVGAADIAGLKTTMRQNTLFARQSVALAQLFRNGSFNAGKSNVRSSLADIFGPNSTLALVEIAKRSGRRVEILFGTVAGAAYEMTFEGAISTSDVDLALEATE